MIPELRKTIEKLVKEDTEFIFFQEIVDQYYNSSKEKYEELMNHYLDHYLKYRWAIDAVKDRRELALKRTIQYITKNKQKLK